MEKRVFKRKIYNKILKWKNESNGETALMVQGYFPEAEISYTMRYLKLFFEINM